MLVLSRKQQEQIVIGDNIKVTILRVKGNTVSLGIEAPRQVRVLRSEITADAPKAAPEAPNGEECVSPANAPLATFLVSLAGR